MSDKKESAVSDSTVGDQTQVSDQNTKPSGQSDTIVQRLLAEKKKEQEKRRGLEERLSLLEQEKLEAEGKKDELIKTLKAQAQETAKKYNQATATYAQKLVESQLSQKAKEFGCVDTELLAKAIDLNSLEVSEDFTVDAQSLETQLNQIRQSKPYLFKAEAPKFKDGVPTNKQQQNPATDIHKMSLEEMKKFAIERGIR
jgi:hypothetical protein